MKIAYWRLRKSRQSGAVWLVGAAAVLMFQPVVMAQRPVLPPTTADDAVCAACHEEGTQLARSAHAGVRCAQCHSKREEYPHPEKLPAPDCASCHKAQAADHARSVHGRQLAAGNGAGPDCGTCHGTAHEAVRAMTEEFRKTVPDTCGMCHSDVQAEFASSVHGEDLAKGILGVPVCTDCHGEHSILAPKETASPVNPSHIRETCARCHEDLRLSRRFGLPMDRITSFDQSFHGLAAQAGSQTVANCASCHGYHNILPSSNPDSMVSPQNLAKTCGGCHPGAGRRFALGPIHVSEEGVEALAVRWVRNFYLVLIPTTLGLMLLHQGGDWVRKLRQVRFGVAPPVAAAPAMGLAQELRMYGFERLQHALLLVSFVVLVWSGFALKYPDQWWARPLVAWEMYGPVRGTVHRVAGAVMIAVAVMHAFSLAVNAKLRNHWLTLFPRRRDLVEGVQSLAYNIGLRSAKPSVSPHSYIEKVEYWAVIWGTLIMGITGVMLWANNLMLTFLPKTALDLAVAVHFYEAVLAALSILVWHLYSVVFDPDVYPMDPAWLTGRSPRQRESHSHPESVSRSISAR